MHSKRSVSLALFLYGFLISSIVLSPAAGVCSAATPDEIDAALAKGTAYLYSQENGDNWETEPRPAAGVKLDLRSGRWGGSSILAVYALLSAGESANSPKLEPAVKFVEREVNLPDVYTAGLRCQIWDLLQKTPTVNRCVQRDGAFLVSEMRTIKSAIGLFGYPNTGPGGYDHSVSQFGVLGAWACAESGFDFPEDFWEKADRGWRAHQSRKGSWAYKYGGNASDFFVATPSMTGAGVATLLEVQNYLTNDPETTDRAEAIDAGLKWMEAHFDDQFTETGMLKPRRFYSLYGCERIGVAGGYKRFGAVDWFQKGADWLISSQKDDGSWGDHGDLMGYNAKAVNSTAFAMLFLAYGGAPVLINKVTYPTPGTDIVPGREPWNKYRRDAANGVRWLGQQLERPVNWQLVDLDNFPGDLNDAPVAYFTGSQKLKFTDDEKKHLKNYVESGGLILVCADEDGDAFERSFRNLAEEFWPGEFHKLADDHPIISNGLFNGRRWGMRNQISAISNGIRELMILAPRAASRQWAEPITPKYTTVEQNQFLANLLIYANGKTLGRKGDTYRVARDDSVHPSTAIRMARLKYANNWDPEPGGWKRLANILHNKFDVELTVDAVTLGDGSLCPSAAAPAQSAPTRPSDAEIRKMAAARITPAELANTGGDPTQFQALIQQKVDEYKAQLDQADAASAAQAAQASAKYKFAHLTGTTRFKLTDEQRKDILGYVAGGGTLIVDAAGGSSDFADSAEAELEKLFGKDADAGLDQPLQMDDPIYTRANAPITEVNYRHFARVQLEGKLKAARIRAIRQNGRIVCYYSREDLSAGLVGNPVAGVLGYVPESATAIMRNIVLQVAGK